MAALQCMCLVSHSPRLPQAPALSAPPHGASLTLRPIGRLRPERCQGTTRAALSAEDQSTDRRSGDEAATSAVSPLPRRNMLQAAAAGAAALLAAEWRDAPQAMAAAVSEKLVGSFLPKTDDGKFCIFTPGTSSTPALRAGNVSPYTFLIPPTWSQLRIANILSGNYCQPKCAEPWIEVKFEDPKQGTLQVVASPMVRLTNRPNQKIEEIGPPEKIIAALGPFVTGDSFDPEEVVATSVRQAGSQTYYDYVLETPYARSGTHNLAAATAKGNTVLLMVVSASDAQWASSQDTLRKLVESFSV